MLPRTVATCYRAQRTKKLAAATRSQRVTLGSMRKRRTCIAFQRPVRMQQRRPPARAPGSLQQAAKEAWPRRRAGFFPAG